MAAVYWVLEIFAGNNSLGNLFVLSFCGRGFEILFLQVFIFKVKCCFMM